MIELSKYIELQDKYLKLMANYNGRIKEYNALQYIFVVQSIAIAVLAIIVAIIKL